jgi:hypothetical protein
MFGASPIRLRRVSCGTGSRYIVESESFEQYEFVIPLYPSGTSGTIEVAFGYTLDGRLKEKNALLGRIALKE